MFATRYFCARFYAPRYFPKVGSAVTYVFNSVREAGVSRLRSIYGVARVRAIYGVKLAE